MFYTLQELSNMLMKNSYGKIRVCVAMDGRCNASCSFCILRMPVRGGINPIVACSETTDHEWFLRFENLLRILRGLQPEFILSGGEPSISARLPKTVGLLNDYGFRNTCLITNGSALKDISRFGGVHIHMSRMHYDDCVNAKIMRFQDSFSRNSQLACIPKTHISIGCIPMKHAVDSVAEILKFAQVYHELGVSSVSFCEIQYDAADANNVTSYCASVRVDAWELVKDLKAERIKVLHEEYRKNGDFVAEFSTASGNFLICRSDLHQLNISAHAGDGLNLTVFPDGRMGDYTIGEA